MPRILLTIAYDGTAYSGWQKQKNPAVRTVEGTVEEALSALFGKPVEVIGASRTDAGVHALGQRAVLDIETSIPTEKLPLALLKYLPEDITVVSAQTVADTFHPRFDCVKKTYSYRIWNGKTKNPKERLYAAFEHIPLDEERMNAATKKCIGTFDFASFCAAGSQALSTVRTIFDCHVQREGDAVTIFVTGDGFLYHMVRILAGTLIQVGKGRLAPEQMEQILLACDRTQAGPTAPAAGLTLEWIFYD